MLDPAKLKRQRRVFRVALGVLSVLIVATCWELMASAKLASGIALPSLVTVATRGWELRIQLLTELDYTLERAALGLALAIVTMIPLGLLIGRSRVWARLIEPVVELLRPLPTPAIIPFVMLIAGISDAAKVAIVFFGASFPILLNTIESVRNVHPMVVLTARSLRLTTRESFFLVYLPQALPQVMAGIRTSVSMALLISVTAEMLLSTNGLGVFLRLSQESFRMADGLAGIALLAVCAFLINRVNVWCEKKLLFWHSSHATGRDNS